MQGKKCGVSWAAKSHRLHRLVSRCRLHRHSKPLTALGERASQWADGGGHASRACMGWRTFFPLKCVQTTAQLFNIHHLNKPLFHWVILQLWLWRTITLIIHFDIVFIMNHFGLVLKIKDMAAHVLCVCVTAKAFFYYYYFYLWLARKFTGHHQDREYLLYGTRLGSYVYLSNFSRHQGKHWQPLTNDSCP